MASKKSNNNGDNKKATTTTATKNSSTLGTSKASDKPVDKPKVSTDDKKDTKTLNKASQADTLRATSNITPTPGMADLLSRMRDIEDDDTEGYPEPTPPAKDVAIRVDTDNLPKIASKALIDAGVVNPTFHQVANLPGNMSRAIRTLGKQLFRTFTRTPTDEIYMIGDVGGMGPNSRREVNAVAGYLQKHGDNLGLGEIDFDRIIPGYKAQINQYEANGIRWLVVKDDFGVYIYTWPEEDSVEMKNQADQRMLPDLSESVNQDIATYISIMNSIINFGNNNVIAEARKLIDMINEKSKE